MLLLQVLIVYQLLTCEGVGTTHEAKHTVCKDGRLSPHGSVSKLKVLRGLRLDNCGRPEGVASDSLAFILSGSTHCNHCHAILRDVIGCKALVRMIVRLYGRTHRDHSTKLVLGHDGQTQRGQSERSTDIDLRYQVILVHWCAFHGVPPQSTGVVDNNIDPAKRVHCLPHARLDGLKLPHVYLNRQGLHSQTLELLGHREDRPWQGRLLLDALSRDHYVTTLLGQSHCTRLANPSSRATNDCDPASQIGRLQLRAERSWARHTSYDRLLIQHTGVTAHWSN
mmetsp:Transcript_46665/g.110976  ORF Transcript_46665/g.110976 Transcript_46665/m.110976 type:complete len:281 (-) Transcript_46665:13-855(-)